MIARVPGVAEFAERQLVGVSWLPEHAHVFDESSGRRVDPAVDNAGSGVDRRAASL
jgi:hypothetical protein